MSRMLNQKNIKFGVLVLLISTVVLVATRSLLGLPQYPVQQAAELRRQLATAQDLQFEKRIQLETALLQYETDNRIKIWTAIIQAAVLSQMVLSGQGFPKSVTLWLCRDAEGILDKGNLPEYITLAHPPHLPFPDHVHGFVSGNRADRSLAGAEPQTGGDALLDEAVVLFQDII